MKIQEELFKIDSQLPPRKGRPAINIVGIPHSGNRSVEVFLRQQNYHTRIIHLQWHHHKKDFIAELLATEPCVIVIRDPLLSLLSTAFRRDDNPKSVLGYAIELWELTWSEWIIPIEFQTDFPVVDKIDYPSKRAYYNQDIESIRRFLPVYDDLVRVEDKLRPKLENLGYQNLLWWS